MQRNEIEKLFYIDKNYSGIRNLLKNSNEIRSFNILGKIELYSGNIKEAYNYFNKAQNIYGCCYCNFLTNKINEAKTLLNIVKESSSAVNWLICLINILEDNYNQTPTYFQIRNYYEQDLNMLFLYKKTEYIKKIINENSYLEYFNREIYKYSGRVLLNNNQWNLAEKFLKKSLDIFYKDPETHYLLGELYEKEKDYTNAKKEYKLANEVNKGYYPAINKLKELGSN